MLGCLTQALLKMIFRFPTWDMLVPCRVTPLKWCKVCQVRWIRGLEMEADFWRGKLSLNPEENVSLERLKRWLSTGEVPWTLPGDDLCHYLKDARRTGGWLRAVPWLQWFITKDVVAFLANLPLWIWQWTVWLRFVCKQAQQKSAKIQRGSIFVGCRQVFAPYHEFWILDLGLWHQSHCNVKINQWRSLQLMVLRDSTWRSLRVFELFLLRFGWVFKVVKFEDKTIGHLISILQISEGLSQHDSLNFRRFLTQLPRFWMKMPWSLRFCQYNVQ